MPPESCPNCGADVPPKARACPACGADEHTGWTEQAHADNLGLPDEHFDYEEFVKEEFGGQRSRSVAWYWWVAAVAVLLGFLSFLF